jgi:hypothetical protein
MGSFFLSPLFFHFRKTYSPFATLFKQHRLYFSPEPQGQGSFRPIFGAVFCIRFTDDRSPSGSPKRSASSTALAKSKALPPARSSIPCSTSQLQVFLWISR